MPGGRFVGSRSVDAVLRPNSRDGRKMGADLFFGAGQWAGRHTGTAAVSEFLIGIYGTAAPATTRLVFSLTANSAACTPRLSLASVRTDR
jgi:hypothetical protein